MSEERVPVSLEGEMKDDRELGMVDMGKHSEELAVDVFGG